MPSFAYTCWVWLLSSSCIKELQATSSLSLEYTLPQSLTAFKNRTTAFTSEEKAVVLYVWIALPPLITVSHEIVISKLIQIDLERETCHAD